MGKRDLTEFFIEVIGNGLVLFIGVYSIALGTIGEGNLFIVWGLILLLLYSLSMKIEKIK